MKFNTFLLRCNRVRTAQKEDFNKIINDDTNIYRSKSGKFLYEIHKEWLEERFLFLHCNYDNAISFTDHVVNTETGLKEKNPRTKIQIEPRKQFFACYDCKSSLLYLNDYRQKMFLQGYLNDSTGEHFQIANIYKSVDEFCNSIKVIKGFQYTQVNNLFTQNDNLFRKIANVWGQDLPDELNIKIKYGGIPLRQGGRQIVDLLCKNKEYFKKIIIIGGDDANMEKVYNFESVLEQVSLSVEKDENDRYDYNQVRNALLAVVRN